MRIVIQSDYVRGMGYGWQRYEVIAMELRQCIVRILNNRAASLLLSPGDLYDLQDMLRRLNEDGLSLASDIRELFAIADRVDALAGGGSYSRPPWFVPSFFPSPASLVTRFSLPQVYRSPRTLTSIAARIVTRRRDPRFISERGVNDLADRGIYVNQADLGPA